MIANHNKLRAIAIAGAFSIAFGVAVGCSSTTESSTAPTETRRMNELSQISKPEENYYLLKGAAIVDPDIAHDQYVGRYFDQDGRLKSFSEIAGDNSDRSFPIFNAQMLNFTQEHGSKPAR